MWKGLISPILDILTITAAALVLLGGFWILRSESDQVLPTLMAFVLVLHRLMTRLAALNESRALIAHTMPSAEVVADILDEDDKEFTRSGGVKVGSFDKKIVFDNVDFSYSEKGNKALKGLDFEISKGKVLALVGPSGSGKTTTVDLLLGLYEPTYGMITMDSVSLVSADPRFWRKNFGVVSQDSFMFNASVYENIAFGNIGATYEQVYQAAKAAHADEFISQLEDGYDTLLGDRGYRLSGGQLQRLALARALITDANILVLDEATSSLDTLSEKLIMRSINELRGDRTIVIIAHRLSTVVNADEILVMQHGRIVERGKHEELVAKKGVYFDLWQLQTTVEKSDAAVGIA